MKPFLGLYIHIPFCAHICPFCDFPTVAIRRKKDFEEYLEILQKEVVYYGKKFKETHTVDTIYFGGGTPSLFPIEGLEALVGSLRRAFDYASDVEFSLEVNPGTMTRKKLDFCRLLGINRISLGAQTFDNERLRRLGRDHSVEQILQTYDNARKASFSNISIDIMMGIPLQDRKAMKQDLNKILDLSPEHVSAYILTLEPGHEPQRWRIDDDVQADLFQQTSEFLDAHHYQRYEISNYARIGWECRHNMKYWRSQEFLGLGLGAHSFMREEGGSPWGIRWSNSVSLKVYATSVMEEKMSSGHREVLDPDTSLKDELITRLRLREGIDLQELSIKYMKSFYKLFRNEIDNLCREGLVDFQGSVLKLTTKGISVSNYVLGHFC